MNNPIQNYDFISSPLDQKIKELISQGLIEDAYNLISHNVVKIAYNDRFVGKYIYTPTLDNIINEISNIVCLDDATTAESSSPKFPVILATELYKYGGHSQIVKDFKKIFPDSLVICTGFFGGIVKRQTGIVHGLDSFPMLALPISDHVLNTKRLFSILKQCASEVFMLTHHHDVVGNVACASLNRPVYFIHHSDHRLSLGSSNSRFRHIDIVVNMHEFCKEHSKATCIYWPQAIEDYGVKNFSYPIRDFSTATSGAANKFLWEGELAFPNVVAYILNKLSGYHYHIGALSDQQIGSIFAALENYGISRERFVYINNVSSLWKSLKELPVSLFVGSFPMHGLRTSIEVQGAGIPILPFKQPIGTVLDDTCMYPSEIGCWNSIHELSALIDKVTSQHQLFSSAARKHYEINFSKESLIAAISMSRSVVI